MHDDPIVAATPVYGCANDSAPSNGQCAGAGTTSRTRYIYLDGKLIAEDDSALGVIYTHADALGSPVARTTPVGGVLARTRFEPYGQVAAGFNPNGANRVGFTGHVNDVATGLTYMQQRYYDPIAGRFLSVDPVVTDANTGRGFGLYTYVDNNPDAKIDPDGREPKMGECGWAQGQCQSYTSSSSGGSWRGRARNDGDFVSTALESKFASNVSDEAMILFPPLILGRMALGNFGFLGDYFAEPTLSGTVLLAASIVGRWPSAAKGGRIRKLPKASSHLLAR